MSRADLTASLRMAQQDVDTLSNECDRLTRVAERARAAAHAANERLEKANAHWRAIKADLDNLRLCDWENCEATATWLFTPLDRQVNFHVAPVMVQNGRSSKSCFEHMTCFAGSGPMMIEEITK